MFAAGFPARASQQGADMKKVVVLASLVASGMFAACRHPAPTPAKPVPREAPPLAQRPKRIDPTPVPIGVPTTQGDHYTVHARVDHDPLIGDDDETPQPSSVKPDAGILYDAGAPLPPVPDGGPLPGVRDAGQPMSQ
jgi:hypothetical protein